MKMSRLELWYKVQDGLLDLGSSERERKNSAKVGTLRHTPSQLETVCVLILTRYCKT